MGVETRERVGRSLGGLTKIRLGTIVSIRLNQEILLEMEKEKFK